MKLPSLTVFFPFLNDGAAIGELLDASHLAAAQVAARFEVLVIDDGSRPDEAQALDRVAAAYPLVRVIRHPRNEGYGAALRRGIAESAMDWIFYTDGDGQYDPLELRLLWRRWREEPGADIVNGYKMRRSDSCLRLILGEGYRRLTLGLYGLPIRDVNCDFRLLRGDLARGLRLRSRGGGVGLELILSAREQGARFSEVGVGHHPRRSGPSAFFTARGLRQLGEDFLRIAGRFRLRGGNVR